MSRQLVWDLPTRIFHWSLAGGFIASATIALVLGDDSPVFPYHAILGLTIAMLVVLRLVWGVAGSRYARLSSFLFSPASVVAYTKGVLTRTGYRHVGHNPGSSYAIFAMFAIVLALAITGFMLGTGNESVKEIHEILAYSMLAVVGLHVLGVVVHTVQHRENITMSMIHGHKDLESTQTGIGSSHALAATVMVVVAGGWAGALIRNYEPATQSTTLPLLGTTLTLGESEEEHERGGSGDSEYEDHDENDD